MSSTAPTDEYWMQQALGLARNAAALGEVPVGALVIRDGQMIGAGSNAREQHQDAIRHAEIDAISAACKHLGSWRLTGCRLIVTLEPCLMCAGAIYQARIGKVIFGAMDPKAGAMGSLYSVHEDTRLNHRLPVVSGVLAADCAAILRAFFKARR